MTLRIHNTLSGKAEPFVPLNAGRVTFYTCGPTVYDYAHIGNFRSFLAADVLRRWLESPLCRRVEPDGTPADAFGYRVTQVMNITDVGHMVDDADADGQGDDKMEAARKRLAESKKSGKLPEGVSATFDPNDPHAIADYYAGAFIDDARTLGLRVVRDADDDPSLMPRPTQHIRGMLEMIIKLIDNGHAYVAPPPSDGVVYFDTQSFPDYGRLSGNTLDKTRSGAGGRVDEATQGLKKHPADFMLWKPDPRHLMRWDPVKMLSATPALADRARELGLREGYPGWHIECSVMAADRLGERIDLHSGGEDNIFPHHECEIAQSRCAFSTEFFARYWFHPRFLFVEGAKMSKSKGNFFKLRDLTGKGFAPDAIRLELIKTHYRSNANFTEQGLRDSARMIARWREFVKRAESAAPSAPEGEGGPGDANRARGNALSTFAQAMNDDLNVAGAIGAINTWINTTPAPTEQDADLMRAFDAVLGVLELAHEPAPGGSRSDDDAEIDALVRARDEARRAKNWAESDRIRDELAARGIAIKDSPGGGGATWERKASL